MKSRLALLILFFGFAAIALGWVYESRLKPVTQEAELLFPNDIDYFLTNMHYRELNAAGKLDFEFSTPRLEHYPLEDVSKIEVPSMKITSASGPWQIDSISGEFRHRQNLLNLRDQVVMLKQGREPMQVYTDNIYFEPDRELVHTDSDILIVNRHARIKAQSAEFDLATRVYRFNQTRSVYHHEDS